MELHVDLLRELMFSLEARQRSPRTNVILSLEQEAAELGCTPLEVEQSLDALLRLEYIDGAGHDEILGCWLFRKLTRKGAQFVEAIRTPRDWEQMKRRFGQQPNSST